MTLVIGYGNTLRTDDGIGPQVAALVESRELPQVRVITAHQLTPELAEELSKVDFAVFVDASVIPFNDGLELSRLEPAPADSATTHFFAPATLLALSQRLYGHAPRAWLAQVTGESFEFGEGLTAAAQQRAMAASQRIEFLLQQATERNGSK